MCDNCVDIPGKMCCALIIPLERMVAVIKRNAIQDLIGWKNNEERKPLVLKGARQVGKTWLMKEFGKNYYKSFVYFNFDEEYELKSIYAARALSRCADIVMLRGAYDWYLTFIRQLPHSGFCQGEGAAIL